MPTPRNKIAIVSVINDLATDVRVQKTCSVLVAEGYEVLLIGRRLPHSIALPDLPYKTIRMPLLFKKGIAFYFFFNIRLFFNLLFHKADVVFANDLDTLLPNYLISKLKGMPLIYDSHEIFCEVPELQNSPMKKKIWETLEKKIVPKLKYALTVNDSIAQYFKQKYKVHFHVVRNIPPSLNVAHQKTKLELNLPLDKKIILLQGAGINVNRGAEELVSAMQYLDHVYLLIIGSGDVWEQLITLRQQLHLEKKIQFIHKIPKADLIQYTLNADLGISLDKNTNLNYQYSLPNKVFDYIQCEVPILATRLLEIEKIILHYQIGDCIDELEPKALAEKINTMLESNEYSTWKKNLIKAKNELNWDNEKNVLVDLIKGLT